MKNHHIANVLDHAHRIAGYGIEIHNQETGNVLVSSPDTKSPNMFKAVNSNGADLFVTTAYHNRAGDNVTLSPTGKTLYVTSMIISNAIDNYVRNIAKNNK